MPPNTMYVGPGTRFGNPFEIGLHEYGGRVAVWTREEVISFFEQELSVIAAQYGMSLEEFLQPLRGHDLACWCPLDQLCHADVLLRLANKEHNG